MNQSTDPLHDPITYRMKEVLAVQLYKVCSKPVMVIV